MAYLPIASPEDDQTETTGSVNGNPAPATQATDGSIATAADTTATQPAAPPVDTNAQTADAGGFTNLSKWLNANQGGAQVVGNQVGQDVQKSADDTTAAIKSGTTDFANTVNQNVNNYNSSLTDAAATDAKDYLNNDDLTKELSGTYNGPTSFAGSAQDNTINGLLNTAQQKQGLAGTVAGRTQLIKDTTTQPLTTGGANLDQALVQETQPAYNTVATAANNVEPLAQNYADATTGANAGITAAQQTNLATQQAALDRLKQGTTDILGNINTGVDTANTNNTAINQTVLDFLSQLGAAGTPGSGMKTIDPVTNRATAMNAAGNGETGIAAPTVPQTTPAATVPPIPANVLAALGITQQQWDQVQTEKAALAQEGANGVDLSKYYTPGTSQLGTGDVATADQVANLGALAQLTGTTAPVLTKGPGTTNSSFDINSALGALGASRDAYNATQKAATANQITNSNGVNPSTGKAYTVGDITGILNQNGISATGGSGTSNGNASASNSDGSASPSLGTVSTIGMTIGLAALGVPIGLAMTIANHAVDAANAIGLASDNAQTANAVSADNAAVAGMSGGDTSGTNASPGDGGGAGGVGGGGSTGSGTSSSAGDGGGAGGVGGGGSSSSSSGEGSSGSSGSSGGSSGGSSSGEGGSGGEKDGGPITGPGTSRSDSIPTNLSNGEFVIPADVVKMPGMKDFLDNLLRLHNK